MISCGPGSSPGKRQDRSAEGKDLGVAILASTEHNDNLNAILQ